MSQYEKVPDYVAASPQEVAQARKQLTELRKNPAWELQSGARRAAVQAKFNSGMLLTALEYVQFEDIVPAGYSTNINAGLAEQNARAEAERRKTMAEFQEQERKRREQPRPLTQREAQAFLSPIEYLKWCDNNQALLAKEII